MTKLKKLGSDTAPIRYSRTIFRCGAGIIKTYHPKYEVRREVIFSVCLSTEGGFTPLPLLTGLWSVVPGPFMGKGVPPGHWSQVLSRERGRGGGYTSQVISGLSPSHSPTQNQDTNTGTAFFSLQPGQGRDTPSPLPPGSGQEFPPPSRPGPGQGYPLSLSQDRPRTRHGAGGISLAFSRSRTFLSIMSLIYCHRLAVCDFNEV